MPCCVCPRRESPTAHGYSSGATSLQDLLWLSEEAAESLNGGIELETSQNGSTRRGGRGEARKPELVLRRFERVERRHLHAAREHDGIGAIHIEPRRRDVDEIPLLEPADLAVVGHRETDRVDDLDARA